MLKNILKIRFQQTTNNKPLCRNIYKYYVEYDNTNLGYYFKKLFYIYLKCCKERKRKALYQWKIITVKIYTFMNRVRELIHNQKRMWKCNSYIDKTTYHLSIETQPTTESNIMITKPNEFSIIPNKLPHKKKLKILTLDFLNRNYDRKVNIQINRQNERKLKKDLQPKSERKRKTASKKKINNSDYINVLYNTYAKKEDKIEQLRLKRDNELTSIYPFIPHLSTKSFRTSLTDLTSPFLSRLQQYEKNRQSHLNLLRNKYELERPHPRSLSKKNSKVIIIPISSNYFELRKRRLSAIQTEIDREHTLTFRPKLNDRRNKSVKDNLIIRNQKFLTERENKLLMTSNRAEKECTFTPSLISKRLNSHKSFDERLIEYHNLHESHKEAIRLRCETNYSFNPILSPNTDMILNNKKIMNEQLKRKNNQIKITVNKNNKHQIEEVNSNQIKGKSLIPNQEDIIRETITNEQTESSENTKVIEPLKPIYKKKTILKSSKNSIILKDIEEINILDSKPMNQKKLFNVKKTQKKKIMASSLQYYNTLAY